MAKRRPKGKVKLELLFDSESAMALFKAWYLDGGGEQDAELYTDSWGKDWMYIKPGDKACPECSYEDYRVSDDSDLESEKLQVSCQNCGHDYELDNPDFD